MSHTRAPANKRATSRRRSALGYSVVVLGWTASMTIGGSLDQDGSWRWLWLTGHLAALVVGLGAAVMVEYSGLLWVLRRATLAEVRAADRRLAPLAWSGYAGLLATGAALAPDLGNPATIVKLVAVLVIGMNGITIGRIARELDRLPADSDFRGVATPLRTWCVGCGALSQAAWWTAVLIGALNTAGRG